MIFVEHVETYGWEAALRGMRNPLDSWDRADSTFEGGVVATLGPNDEALMRRLVGLGTPDHRKFLRAIGVSMDVTAPLYWWKEADQYKVGTVTDSCSTMHTVMRRPFSVDMFAHDRVTTPGSLALLDGVVGRLNELRDRYLAEGRPKALWDELIQLLPSSWLQRRTWTLNYEVVRNLCRARRDHRLSEWRELVATLEGALPLPWLFS